MAKIFRKNLDSIRPAPIRQNSYEAPAIRTSSHQVPKEFQTFERASRRGGGLIWLVFLLFLATVGGFIFWTNRSPRPVDNSLQLIVDGPSQLVSGDQAVYIITYKNLDVVPLEQMELDVHWPGGFYFNDATVKAHDDNATTWTLNDLPVGGEGELKITGQLVGQKDEELSALFSLQYQPQNFHSDFKAKQEIKTKITENPLELSIQATDQTMIAKDQEIKLTYKNISSDVLNDLYLDVLYPDGFDVASTSPAKDGDYWKFNLQPSEEQSVVIKGSFAAGSKSQQLLVAEIGNLVDNKFRPLARLEKMLAVVNPQFTINLQINGQSENQSVDWGEVLRYQLEVANDSDSELTGVQIAALLDGGALDWNSLDTVGRRDGSKIIWTPTENSDLAKWPAGESRTFTWQLKVADKQIAERNIDNIIQINMDGLPDWQQVSSPVVLTVGKSLIFNQGAYWHLAGRRVGAGLLPPQVGEETQYLVVWSINESSGIFHQVVAEAPLPPEVNFVSETDVQAGKLDFDKDRHTLTWTIAEFSKEILPLTASFMISFVPSEGDRGSAIILLNSATITGQGQDELILKSNLVKTTDVVANSTEPIGIIQ